MTAVEAQRFRLVAAAGHYLDDDGSAARRLASTPMPGVMESAGAFPDSIGRYQVLGSAGVGGFATVYQGYDGRLESRVAIKVLADNWSREPDIHRRFRQEAVLLRRLSVEEGMSQIVEVFDIDETATGQPSASKCWTSRVG